MALRNMPKPPPPPPPPLPRSRMGAAAAGLQAAPQADPARYTVPARATRTTAPPTNPPRTGCTHGELPNGSDETLNAHRRGIAGGVRRISVPVCGPARPHGPFPFYRLGSTGFSQRPPFSIQEPTITPSAWVKRSPNCSGEVPSCPPARAASPRHEPRPHCRWWPHPSRRR